MNRLAILAFAIVASVLSGCAGLDTLNRASQPTDLYLLTPKSTFDPKLPRISQQIVVEVPTATAAVDNDRIAIQPTALKVQYLPRARWVDRAPLIVQALLIESYENSGKVGAVGRSASGVRADYHIVTDIREFQVIVKKLPDGSDQYSIDVRLNIKIIDAFDDRIIGSNSFEELVIAQGGDVAQIVTAFDEALGDTMRDAVEWSIRKISVHASRNPRPDLG